MVVFVCSRASGLVSMCIFVCTYVSQEVGGTLIEEDGPVVLAGAEWY
jgi:hypothetical protein